MNLAQNGSLFFSLSPDWPDYLNVRLSPAIFLISLFEAIFRNGESISSSSTQFDSVIAIHSTLLYYLIYLQC